MRESKWSRVQPGSDRHVKKDCARAKMEQEQSKRDRARETKTETKGHCIRTEKSLTDTRTTLRSLSNSSDYRFAISTAISCPSTLHQHAKRGYNGYLLAYFRIFFCTKHTLCMRTPSCRSTGFTEFLLVDDWVDTHCTWLAYSINIYGHSHSVITSAQLCRMV